MNTKVQISLEHSVLVSFEYSLGGGILDHMVVLFLTLWGFSIPFSMVAIPIYNPIDRAQGFPFLHNLASICYLLCCLRILHFSEHFSNYAIRKAQSDTPSLHSTRCFFNYTLLSAYYMHTIVVRHLLLQSL